MMRRAVLVCAVAAGLERRPRHGPVAGPGARLPDSAGAAHQRDLLGRVLGAAARDGPHRHHRRDLQAERDHRPHQELRDRRRRRRPARSAPGTPSTTPTSTRSSRARRTRSQTRPDPALDGYVDALIAKIAKAQEPDGYLYTARTINPAKAMPMAGKERWINEEESHELYNVGHLYEAAVAHYQATGKTDAARRRDQERRSGLLGLQPAGAPRGAGPPGDRDRPGEALPRRPATGSTSTQAKFFLDERGKADRPQALRRVRAGSQAGRRADRGRRPLRARGLHVLGHGRRRGADRRPAGTSRRSTASGTTSCCGSCT